jgi:hypothetical protein
MNCYLMLFVVFVSGCAQHRVVAPICVPTPAPTTGFYCYPVDGASGQQMCVRQIFNAQEEW